MVRNKRAKPSAEDAPTVGGVVDAMEQGRAEIVVRLREIALGLAGTSERTVYTVSFESGRQPSTWATSSYFTCTTSAQA